LEDVAPSLLCYKTRKMYYHIQNIGLAFYRLCKPCAHYLLERETDVKDYWAAIIGVFLLGVTIHDDIMERSLTDKWRLIPSKWRHCCLVCRSTVGATVQSQAGGDSDKLGVSGLQKTTETPN
jgi:hypothetical protein